MPIRKVLQRMGVGTVALAAAALLSQCSDTAAPDPPAGIAITSGDNQFSLRGTELPEPLEVRVKTKGGVVAQDATVRFSVIEGGGRLSRTAVKVSGKGLASTRLTLGPDVGTNRVRAAVEGTALSVVFQATAANFYCPEANDVLQVCDGCPTRYGPKNDLFLATQRSSLTRPLSASIVQAKVSGVAFEFLDIPPDADIFPPIIWDAAFSQRGDYYIARRTLDPEILKIDVNGRVTHFASLDVYPFGVDDAVEITTNPFGLLVGCDVRGPFVVGCRDTLLRFPEATFPDLGVNNDAVAVDPRRQIDDPLGEDIYFIYKPDSTLRRLPLDSLQVEPRGLEIVAQLTRDEAVGARGMVCDGVDGQVYILVDTDDTKELLAVTPVGGTQVLADFFTRGGGSAAEAGMQRDLAFKRPLFYTLDTLNDKLVAVNLFVGEPTPLFSDSLEQAKLSKRDGAGNPSGGERVGLSVLQ